TLIMFLKEFFHRYYPSTAWFSAEIERERVYDKILSKAIPNNYEIVKDRKLNSIIYIINERELDESKKVWSKKGKKEVQGYRCSAGFRKGKVVSSPAACFAPVDIQKRVNLKKTKSKYGSRMSTKAVRSKKFNPVSKRVKQLNKGLT